jgi:hypothetical protein
MGGPVDLLLCISGTTIVPWILRHKSFAQLQQSLDRVVMSGN